MLVLDRRKNERIIIGDDIVIQVVEIRGESVKLGILAPIEITVDREEIAEKKRRNKRSNP